MGVSREILNETRNIVKNSFVSYFKPLFFINNFLLELSSVLLSFNIVQIVGFFNHYLFDLKENESPLNFSSLGCVDIDRILSIINENDNSMVVFGEILVIKNTNIVGSTILIKILNSEQLLEFQNNNKEFNTHHKIISYFNIYKSDNKEEISKILMKQGVHSESIIKLLNLK